jgi:toxin ParE1/3/4
VPLEIVWSPLARERLREIHDYVARDKPRAAARLAIRIVALVESLKYHSHLGRAGPDPETRELVIGGTPYVVLYRITSMRRITINTIWHGAQQRPH